jgi:hypothetical protein
MVRGQKLYRTRNTNAPLPGSGVLPDPSFIDIDQFESSGRCRSHSLTFSLQTTLRNRFDLLGQYTFSKSMDDARGMFSLPANNYDLRPEYGRSDYDRRHRFNLISICHLPWDFRAGTIVSMNSGIPYNITTGFDNNGDTVPNDRPLGISRNTGAGPGYASVDFHLSKRITFAKNESKDGGARPAEKHASGRLSNLGEGRREGHGRWLEVGIDAFNVFNRVNFKNFVGVQTSRFSSTPTRLARLANFNSR